MVPLRWRDSLSLDVPVIDKDHKTLIDLLNRVHYLGLSGDDRDAIGATIGELISYTRTHFAREEMLMRLAGYPGYEAHRRMHEGLTRRADAYAEQFQRSSGFDLGAFYDFLADWLVSHILEQDMKIKPYVENLEESRAA
jgi:hemerythrin-like metal-binding protein